MKARFFLALLLIGSAPAAAAPGEDRPPIVVTGRSLSETERALAECLRRHCPPDQDIDATLAHAENQFVAGGYKGARATTLASLERNRGHAKDYPVAVSDLYRANGRIAAHLGEGKDYEWSTTAVGRTLRAGLPKDDPRLIGAQFESASMYAALGRPERALDIYDEARSDAERIGRPDLVAMARLRAAWLHHLAGDTDVARRTLKDIAAERAPELRLPRVTALVLLARLDRKEGRLDSSDALITELRALGAKRPVLIYSPPIDRSLPEARITAGSITRLLPTQDYEDEWVDIGFWVTPEGRVDDVEILRSRGSPDWAKPVLRSIRGRLYAAPADGAGSYRVERYTFTSLWKQDRVGTHLRMRSNDNRIEFLDLTAEPETAAR
ncbi:MAG: tetratricopeptide repeat protein [Allosphingosinicella sp.]